MPHKSELVVVANRLPVRRRRKAGREHWDTSPGGLVTAIMPILRRWSEQGRGGAWVGWSGARTKGYEPFDHEGVRNVPVNLTSEQLSDYYDGMANATIWPLYHDCVRPPIYRRRWWRAYQDVNRAFADHAARTAADGATIWVQDYHLHLLPGMLRALRPDLRIGFFLHTPFPGPRLFARLPWRREVVEGTLGADVVGFQTADDATNFVEAAGRFAHAERGAGEVGFAGRRVRTEAFPISIDARRFEETARREDVLERAARHRRRLGDRRIMLGVDRMDYTKGIPLRLHAYRELLRARRVSPNEVVLIQSCVPTRERVDAYAALRSEVEELVGQINGEFGEVGRGSVHYLRQSLPAEELVALYLAADIALITPERDGMNLIAKEYPASRHDERGVLVLSEFTGAVHELSDALKVNPHDVDGTVGTIERALRMEKPEQRTRMRALRATIFGHDVYHWADSFMADLRDIPGPAPAPDGGHARVEIGPTVGAGRLPAQRSR